MNFHSLNIRFFIVNILLFFVFLVGNTQVDSIKVQTLPEVRLTSLKIIETKFVAPISVSIINTKEIQDILPQLSLHDYINTVPGIFALNANNFSQDLRVSIRGFGARSAFGIRGIKILVDDIPETTPDGQGQIDNLNIGAIEKLEVIRGPSSALYGNASGGIINITTKDDFESNFVKTGITYGAYNFKQYQIQSGYKLNNSSFILNAANTLTNGYRENSGFKNTNINLKIKQSISANTKLNAQINYSDSPYAGDAGGLTLDEVNSNRRQARTRNLNFNTKEAIKQFKAGVSLNHLWENNTFKTYGFYSSRDFYGLLPFEFGGIVDLGRDYFGLGASYNHKHESEKNKNTFQIGFDFGKQNDDRSRYYNLNGDQGNKTLDQTELFTSFGIYAVNHFKFNKFLLHSSIRYDYNKIEAKDEFLSNGDQSGELKWNSLNPAIGLNFQFAKGHNLYTNFSTSFETPVLSELSANPTNEGGFNESLKPQKAHNYEIGYKVKTKKVYGELALFYIRSEDDIIPYEIETFPGRTFYKNAGRTNRKGVELNYGMNILTNLNLDITYSFSDFRYDKYSNTTDSFDGNELPGIPKHMGAITLFYQNEKGLKLRLKNRYVGKLYVNDENGILDKDYLSTDFNVGYNWKLNNLELIPFFGINNLFDTKYNDNIRINAFGDRYYEPAPGINLYGGIRFLHKL